MQPLVRALLVSIGNVVTHRVAARKTELREICMIGSNFPPLPADTYLEFVIRVLGEILQDHVVLSGCGSSRSIRQRGCLS